MEPLELLERMASISPGVRLHIEGRQWLVNIDEDEITHQMLVNECFAIMINEAYELGIEFFCTLGDLCESFYVIDKTLLLFEVVFPTPLYRSITESDPFKTMISTIVVDGVSYHDESSICTLLERLAIYSDDSMASVFLDTYTFLQDKIKSTPVFDHYVKSILDVDNTPFSPEADVDTIKNYLNYVQLTFTKLLKAADILNNKMKSKSSVVNIYEKINDFKIKASEKDTLDRFSWAYEPKDMVGQPTIQVLVEKYKTQFQASVPFYEDYFILRKLPVSNEDIPTLILGAYIETKTKEAFLSKVTDIFKRLVANDKIITDEMNFIIQNINIVLVQEFYP